MIVSASASSSSDAKPGQHLRLQRAADLVVGSVLPADAQALLEVRGRVLAPSALHRCDCEQPLQQGGARADLARLLLQLEALLRESRRLLVPAFEHVRLSTARLGLDHVALGADRREQLHRGVEEDGCVLEAPLLRLRGGRDRRA